MIYIQNGRKGPLIIIIKPHRFFSARFVALNIMWSQWDAAPRLSLLHFLMTLCSPGSIHIQEKAISGAHKARKGLRIMLGLHSVSPCCFLRSMCDLKDKVVTEGKAGIFNDVPQAHSQTRSFICVVLKRSIKEIRKKKPDPFFHRRHEPY